MKCGVSVTAVARTARRSVRRHGRFDRPTPSAASGGPVVAAVRPAVATSLGPAGRVTLGSAERATDGPSATAADHHASAVDPSAVDAAAVDPSAERATARGWGVVVSGCSGGTR